MYTHSTSWTKNASRKISYSSSNHTVMMIHNIPPHWSYTASLHKYNNHSIGQDDSLLSSNLVANIKSVRLTSLTTSSTCNTLVRQHSVDTRSCGSAYMHHNHQHHDHNPRYRHTPTHHYLLQYTQHHRPDSRQGVLWA